MALSYLTASFIIVMMMFATLVYVANTVITNMAFISKALNTLREENTYLKQALIITSANYLNNCIFFNLSNLGSTAVLLDESSTLLLEYSSSSGKVIEVLEYGRSWSLEGIYIGGRLYSIRDALELRPGVTASIKACPTQVPIPGDPILIVITTSRGVRAEYVFTYG